MSLLSLTQVGEIINKRVTGKTNAAKMAVVSAALKQLAERTAGTVLNFGEGYREFSGALRSFNKLSELFEKSSETGEFSLFMPSEYRSTRVRTTKPVPTAWPWKDSLAGLVVLLGNRGAGKTTFMVSSMNVEIIIRVAEPSEMADADPRTIHALSLEEAFSLAFVCAAAGIRVAIDGLRPLVFSKVGSTTAAGIDSNVYTFLTGMNNVMAAAGHTIVVTLNPMTEKQFDEVAGSVIASVSGVVMMADGAVTSKTYRGADGRTFTDDSSVAQEQDDISATTSGSLIGSLAMHDNGTTSPRLPYSEADFDDDDNPPSRTGSRVTFSN